MKHTPGPWYCDGGVQVRTGQFLAICEAGAAPNRSTDSARANARLIAAAPDMLAVLENIANAKRFDRERFNDDSSFADWAQSRARAAIAKVVQS